MATKYYKNYENLSNQELTCIGKSLFADFENSNISTKPEKIKKIKEKTPNFDQKENNTFYFFHGENGTCTLVEPEPEARPEYTLSRNSGHKNIFFENSDNSESLQTQVDNLTSKLNRQNITPRSKFGGLKFKICYDESKGVNHFINSVERFSVANNISNDSDKIIIAINGLADSDYGEIFSENLTESEKSNWSIFREKLLKLLGKTATFYKTSYRSFKRQPQETLGIMFSRLVFTYKKAYLNTQNLNETDKRILISDFIQKCTPRLAQLMMAEESSLTFDTISLRAEELEQIYALNTNTMDILAVIDQGPKKSQNSEFSEILKEFRRQSESIGQLINTVGQLVNNNNFSHAQNYSNHNQDFSNQNRHYSNHGQNRGNSNRSFQNQAPKLAIPNLELHKLRGFCQWKLFKGECRKKSCNFKHENIPQEILNLKNEQN